MVDKRVAHDALDAHECRLLCARVVQNRHGHIEEVEHLHPLVGRRRSEATVRIFGELPQLANAPARYLAVSRP
jgi:hypothetical protein